MLMAAEEVLCFILLLGLRLEIVWE